MLANSKENRNIKAYDVNLISMARSTDFCLKNVCKDVFVLQIDRRFITLWKRSFQWTLPTPQKLLPLNPPTPLEFPMIFRGGLGGGGVWIFSGTTQLRLMMEVDESEWGWIKVNGSEWRWIGGWRWMKMDEDEWHWMKMDEGGCLWMKVKPWYNEGPRVGLSLRFQVTR